MVLIKLNWFFLYYLLPLKIVGSNYYMLHNTGDTRCIMVIYGPPFSCR